MKNIFKRLNSAFNPNQVGYVIFYVTNICNFRCNFCFYSEEITKGKKNDQLTLDEIVKIAPKIGPLLQLSLTGGEPFLRKDFTQVADILIKNTKAHFVTIPTNGSLPERIEDFYSYLLKAHPDSFFRCVFSIEGIGSIHDELRGVTGSYNKIIRSYEKVMKLKEKYKNLVVDSNSVFTKNSEDTLIETLKHLRKNFKFDNISVTYARGKIPDEKLKSQSRKKYEEVNNFIEQMYRPKEQRRFSSVWRAINSLTRENIYEVAFNDKFVNPCVASRKIVIISETGEVRPCEILDNSLGKLKDFDYDLKKVLASEENRKLKKWIKDSKCKCTFECATAASIAWNYSFYPKVLKTSAKTFFNTNK